MTPPPRGFPDAEFQARTARAQSRMATAGLEALLLTTEPEVRYYTGYLTRFWESPTRPWYVILPAAGMPIAVIPAIGAPVMARTWVSDIRTWPAPVYEDDGVSLLAETLREITGPDARIGMSDGIESHARMPLAHLAALRDAIGSRALVSDGAITRDLRMIKSVAELGKITQAVEIAGRAFARVGEVAAPGRALSDVFRRFQMLCLDEGADWVPYLAGAAGPDGYADVISPATDAPLAEGDVLMLDTGLVWDGYFCDYDRNFGIGSVGPEIHSAHAMLIEATEAAREIAKPGVTMAELYRAMDRILNLGSEAGRLGHGLGMQLTEWPSILPFDHTPAAPGMVLTLEPYVATRDGHILVHEENIVIEEGGARYLSTPAAREIRLLG